MNLYAISDGCRYLNVQNKWTYLREGIILFESEVDTLTFMETFQIHKTDASPVEYLKDLENFRTKFDKSVVRPKGNPYCSHSRRKIVASSYDLKFEDHCRYECLDCGHSWIGYE